MDSRVWLFTKKEFLFLAAAAGIRRMYGFQVDAGSMERADAVLTLQSLTRRGCLTAVNEGFELTELVKSLFLQIRDAATTIDVHKRSGRSCILYIGSAAVRVSPSMRRKEHMEVQEIPLCELWSFLQEEGWIPGPDGLGREI